MDLHYAEDENAPLEEPTYARWVTGHSQEYHENTEGHYDYEQEDQYDYAPNNNDYDDTMVRVTDSQWLSFFRVLVLTNQIRSSNKT